MTTQSQKIKGRARLYLERQYAPKGIETPIYGAASYDLMEVKEYFDQFNEHLQLPEKYNIIGVFFDVSHNLWCLVIEGDDIPLPSQGEMIPVVIANCEYVDVGKLRIIDLKLI